MIAVTNVTNVIKKFESLQGGWFQPNPFVTTKNLYILFLNITVNESFTVAKRDTAFYILAVLELDDDGVGWTDPIQSIQSKFIS